MRFREGKDSKFLVDCEVKNSDNQTIAKIAKNKLVYPSKTAHVDESLELIEEDSGIVLKDKNTGIVYLEFQKLGQRKVKINGIFHVRDYKIDASDERLIIGKGGGGLSFYGGSVSRSGKGNNSKFEWNRNGWIINNVEPNPNILSL